MRVSELKFYDGNGFVCFSCRDLLEHNRFIIGSNEGGRFKIGNSKDVNTLSRVEIEAFVNNEAMKRGIA